jgi:hypothetical protein
VLSLSLWNTLIADVDNKYGDIQRKMNEIDSCFRLANMTNYNMPKILSEYIDSRKEEIENFKKIFRGFQINSYSLGEIINGGTNYKDVGGKIVVGIYALARKHNKTREHIRHEKLVLFEISVIVNTKYNIPFVHFNFGARCELIIPLTENKEELFNGLDNCIVGELKKLLISLDLPLLD